MKAILRASAGFIAEQAGLLAACERASRESLVVLCYHRVLPQSSRARYHTPELVVTPETLRSHCLALAGRYNVEPLATAFPRWRAGENSPGRPLVAITFDDGYRDNFKFAAPILREFNFRATFYAIAGLVDTTELPWYDIVGGASNSLPGNQFTPGVRDASAVLAKAKKMQPAERNAWVARLRKQGGPAANDDDLVMTSDQLRALSRAGHEIGSHTATHPLLTQCSDAELDREIAWSKARLSEIIDAEVPGLCYPNGDYDTRVSQAVAAAGYGYATSLDPGINRRENSDPFALRRWFIAQDRLADARGRPSNTMLRMEICGLSHRLFRRAS